MTRFYLLIFTLILLAGCGSPEPIVHEKLTTYQSINQACQEIAPTTLEAECTLFVDDLQRESHLLTQMNAIREDERQEASYIAMADKEALLALKVHANRGVLAQQCQTQMPTIVKNEDLSSATFCLLFDENTMTLKEYQYLKKHAPKFDNNPQYIAFEKKYAQEQIELGLKALNKGDKRGALNAFVIASEARSPEALYLIGIVYEEKQIKKAIAWHKKAVAAGVNLSKVNLARLYLRIKLPKKAREWYLSAANDNHALAQYRLFKMDAKSKSRKAGDDAQLWLDRSANNNYPQAQYIYGLQLLKQNRQDEAQRWLEVAHKNGISDSNFYLGKIYYQQKSYELAYELLLNAQHKGEANYLLATMYEKGLGVKKNSVMAYRHYKKAHEQAHDNHVSDMKRLQRKLTKKERQLAKYIGKKKLKAAKAKVKRCGPLANAKNIAKAKRTINIVGVAVKPFKHANGFVVYGDGEKIYYIISKDMAKTITNYQYISIKTKTTGKAITISSDTGTVQQVYQLHVKATCK